MWALKFKLVKARLLNPVIPVWEIYPTNILGYVAFNHVWQHPVIAKDRKQFMFLNLLLLFSPKVISDTLWPMDCTMPGSSVLHYLLEFMSIESVMLSNHLILCRPLLLLPIISPSIRVFSNETALHIRWSKYWSFSFSISLSNAYSGLIYFRIDWFDLPAVQGTLKSLLLHCNSKASILWC